MKFIRNHGLSIFAQSAHSRLQCERILTSVFLLAGILCGVLQAQQLLSAKLPPAGPLRPAGVPSSYVITPFGYIHPSCVLQLQKGEYMKEDGVVHHVDGSMVDLGPCQYAHYKASGELATNPSHTNNTVAEQGHEPPTKPAISHAWVEYSSAITDTSYGKGVSTWTVPPVPQMQDGQTIYFFPGFENSTTGATILQPVIGSYNGEQWTMASWNCCSQSGWVNHSTELNINPGDTIVGTTAMTCPAGATTCPTWNITTLDQTAGLSTELSNTPSDGQIFNWAQGGALEVYGVIQCLDYPTNASLAINTMLYDRNLNAISNPNWQNMLVLTADSQPQCNYGVTTTSAQTILTYGTTGSGFGVGVTPAAGIAVNQGSSARGTIAITDINGFTGLVNVSASNLPAGVTTQISQGSSFNTYNITLTATGSAVLAGGNQPATLTLTASGSGVPTQSFPVNVIVNPPLTGGSGTVVDLSNAFNVYSFYEDAQDSSITWQNSIDNYGDVYSANQLSPPGMSPMALNLNGVRFNFGVPNQSNAVYGTGSNPISLPSGTFGGLQLLGASVDGVQESQTVFVTYTDNTTQVFTQSFLDWDSYNPNCNSTDPCSGGESAALVMPYSESYDDYSKYNRLFYLYNYAFPLNSGKTVKSLTLPPNRYVVVLAATLTAGLSTPTVTVTPGATSINTNQALAVTVSVSGGSGTPTATGSVTLSSSSFTSPISALASGGVTISIPAGSLAVGSDSLTASYTPDANSSSIYGSATGTALVTVTTALQGSFTLSNVGSIAVNPGATTGNSTPITVTPAGGFTGQINLVCAVITNLTSPNEPPTCTIGTGSVAISGSAAGTATLSVQTTAPTTSKSILPLKEFLFGGGSMALAGLLLIAVPARRRNWLAITCIALLAIAFSVVGCGGGSRSSNTGPIIPTNPGTTAGAYTVTVTGTDAATGKITSSTTVSLTVN